MHMYRAALAVAALALAQAAGAAAARVADPASPTVLITGSNRGIGLALVEEYARQGWNVIATCRNPRKSEALRNLASQDPRILVEVLDVEDQKAIAKLSAKYHDVPIDVLINNAAMLGDLAGQKVGNLDYGEFRHVMDTNVFGPLKVSEAFADSVAASGQKKIVAITSGLGSLTLIGKMSGFYYYRMSKSALNMGFRGLRVDLKARGITVGIVSPGLVETGLLKDSGFRGKALSAEESAAGLYKLIDSLTPDDPGLPINVDGKVLPW
jgi:NAD(P)-dependent dehydrogenase (short-subunit alcohol dehydrogenase family)